MYSDYYTTYVVGFPIRKSTDQRVLASPRGLSQPITSFFASQCQGIHKMPLCAWFALSWLSVFRSSLSVIRIKKIFFSWPFVITHSLNSSISILIRIQVSVLSIQIFLQLEALKLRFKDFSGHWTLDTELWCVSIYFPASKNEGITSCFVRWNVSVLSSN